MPYETVSPDDAHSILYGTSPKAEITVQPTVQESKAPVAPPKKAKEQEKKNEGVAPTTSLAQQVTNTMDVLKDNTPAPIPASPVTPMTNTIGDLLTSVRDNWLPVVAPVLGYGAYKLGKSMVDGEPKPASPTTPISDRQITRIEPKMDVNQQPSSGRIEPTFSDPVPTQPNVSISPEVTSSTGYTGLAQLEEKHGVQFTGGNDLRTVLKGENNTAIKGGQEPPYPHLLSPEAQQKLAQEKTAGVTPTTSAPEAQTLVTSHEAALDLGEKAQEKVSATEPTKEVKGAVAPRTLNEIAQQPNLSSTFQQHLVNQQKIIQNNPKYEEALAKAYESGKIPKGYVFVPGVGNMDNNVFNTLGPEGRREALEAKGLTAFGQVPEPKNMKYNDVVSKNIADYAQHLRDTIPSVELNTRQERIAKGEPHSTNYGRLVGGPNKEGKLLHTPMKIAGVGGGLMAISSLSQAKSIPEFIARGVDVGTDYLPLVGQIKQGLTPSEAGAPTLPPSAYSESKKLGSPFHVFPNQGRGIMPPSAYR